MKRRRLLWQIFSSFLLTTLALLLAVTWFASAAFRDFYFKQTTRELENNAILVRHTLAEMIANNQQDAIDALCKDYQLRFSNRITVIRRDGNVLGDSDFDIDAMEPHHLREEVAAAFHGQMGTANRFSATIGLQMIYVAIPINIDGNIPAVVRLSRPVTAIEEALHSLQIKIVVAWFLTGILATLLIFNFSQRISKPFESFKSELKTFMNSNFQGSLPLSQSEEIGSWTDIMNQMANQLQNRSLTIKRQQNEVDAILTSMDDAVLAVDSNNRILKMNDAAAALFRIAKNSHGERVQEIIRNRAFNDFVERALDSQSAITEELTFYVPEPEYLRANGTRLLDSESNVIGVVIVLNNVTRYKRLENMRRDFVANVSHELRTPITSIKGFVETLQSGAMDDPDDAERFLTIIERHVNRLSDIIEDLLSLSKIEQEQEEIGLKLKPGSIYQALQYAVQIMTERAEEKQITLHLTCPKNLEAELHDNLFIQAITNLLDNAVKYSPPSSDIYVRGYEKDGHVAVEVQDFGPGIAQVHQARLFERFYRIDRARGRDQGGTGLGLSIVKHIVVAHRGEININSQLDEGSTFIISLPQLPVPVANTQTNPAQP